MLSWKVLLGLSRLADRIIKKKIFFNKILCTTFYPFLANLPWLEIPYLSFHLVNPISKDLLIIKEPFSLVWRKPLLQSEEEYLGATFLN
jgi:hypothetical protein